MKIFKTTSLALFAVFLAVFFLACGDKKKADAMGIFQSDEVLVASEVGGKILEIAVKEGDIVKKSDVLARIDTTQLELQASLLQAQIATLESKKIDIDTQLAPLRDQLKTALREKERTKSLVRENASTKKALDDTSAQVSLLQKQLDSSLQSMQQTNKQIEREITQINLQAQILQDTISKARVSAPQNGVVLEKYAFSGEIATPNKPLFKIANLATLRLKAYFIDTDITRIKLGDKVEVVSDYGEGSRVYEGVVSWIASNAEFTPKTIMTKDERKNLVYAVKIDVVNDGLLKIGSYGEVRLLNTESKGADSKNIESKRADSKNP
ncbi:MULTISPECIES: HlyD family secretion protein [unclassified Helicobacter]|uniref:HlyD family secretion protein n=1 Tax=unclassified Helicobacter TaxID=2593540 RepID=UPI0015F19B82|nr:MULTISPECIES: HlyD family efflux transporter periplasmic adaptor subunit [unclassified Helicobacter]